MNEKSKSVIISVICTVIMCAFVLLAVMYAEGYYDFTFVNRPVEETARQTQPAQTQQTQPDETEAPQTTPPQTDAPVQTPPAEEYLAAGYVPTGEVYDRSRHIIAKLPLSLPDTFVCGTQLKKAYTVTTDEGGILRIFTESLQSGDRKSVELYMGLIIVSEQDTFTVYDSSGRTVMNRYTGSMPRFVYDRDENDNPVFESEGKYYIISGGAFTPSAYTPAQSRGVCVNYPSGFGVSEGEPVAFEKDGLWGYRDENGDVLISARYYKAYSFSNSVGMVEQEDGTVFFINRAGRRVVEGYYKLGDDTVPGSVYYDGGYVMLRNIVIGRREAVAEDNDVLVDLNGDIYTLPVGCSPVAYSNQRVLVEKDGKYGFYAVKGAWVCDTVYDYASPFSEGLAVLGDANGKKGVCDKDGNIIVPFIYTDISVCCDGVFACYNPTSGWEVFVKLGAAE